MSAWSVRAFVLGVFVRFWPSGRFCPRHLAPFEYHGRSFACFVGSIALLKAVLQEELVYTQRVPLTSRDFTCLSTGTDGSLMEVHATDGDEGLPLDEEMVAKTYRSMRPSGIAL